MQQEAKSGKIDWVMNRTVSIYQGNSAAVFRKIIS